MLKKIVAIALPLLTYSNIAFTCDIHGKSGIVEDNDLYISTSEKFVSDITEEKFNEILDRVNTIYNPIIEAKEKVFEIARNWEDGTVNAYAQQIGNTWKISMFGGLARHETITEDAFALVACHELGHHLGGVPKKASWWGISWASNEGQADYFGNLKCLRKFMEEDDNITIVAEMEVDEYAKEQCEANFANENDIAMCMRGAMAGKSLGELFRALRRQTAEINFNTPDPRVVPRTNDSHPAPQCRLDTYFAGSICDKDYYEDVSDEDANVGVCSRADGRETGIRPLCWYLPSNDGQ